MAAPVQANVEYLPDVKQLFMMQRAAFNNFFEKLDMDDVSKLAHKMYECKGSCIFTGVGKSGFVAKKINQTLVSTGTRALWLAPVDALHGDIGLVTTDDLLIMFSKSGTTKELLTLCPYAKAKGAFLVCLTSDPSSPLAKACDMVVKLPIEGEVQAFGSQATESRETPPATSNSLQMLFGDTLAVALMIKRGLTQTEYAKNHPAGRIGKRLVMRVHDVMQQKVKCASCSPEGNGLSVLTTLAGNPLANGAIMVVDAAGKLMGTLQDGDLRRALAAHGKKALELSVTELMNYSKSFPHTCGPDMMAADAVLEMEKHSCTYLPVVSEDKTLEGVVTVKDLLAAGL